jgi:hypothetical protein
MPSALRALGANRAEILMTQVHGPPPAAAPAERRRRRAGAEDQLPGLGRYVATAAAAAGLVVLIVVSAGLLVADASVATALGIGSFAAVWGGGGFGAMIGGVLYVHRFEEPALIPSLVGTEEDVAPALLPPWPSEPSVRG